MCRELGGAEGQRPCSAAESWTFFRSYSYCSYSKPCIDLELFTGGKRVTLKPFGLIKSGFIFTLAYQPICSSEYIVNLPYLLLYRGKRKNWSFW